MKQFILFLIVLASPVYVGADINDGLVAWYPFNGNADDASGNNHNGTIHGASLTKGVGGVGDSAYQFDNVDRIAVPDSDDFSFSTESFSIATWMQFSTVASAYMIGHDEGPGTTDKWIFWVHRTGIFLHVNRSSGGAFTPIEYNNWSPVSHKWYHLAITRNEYSLYTLYINGESVAENTDTRAIPDPSTELWLGDAEGQHPERNFQGILDDVRIYNRFLSSEEVNGLINYPGCIAGDFNCDGFVDLLDLDILGNNWGTTVINYLQGDADSNQYVGLLDLDILGRHWGDTVVIPEPSSIIILAGISMTVMRCKGN